MSASKGPGRSRRESGTRTNKTERGKFLGTVGMPGSGAEAIAYEDARGRLRVLYGESRMISAAVEGHSRGDPIEVEGDGTVRWRGVG